MCLSGERVSKLLRGDFNAERGKSKLGSELLLSKLLRGECLWHMFAAPDLSGERYSTLLRGEICGDKDSMLQSCEGVSFLRQLRSGLLALVGLEGGILSMPPEGLAERFKIPPPSEDLRGLGVRRPVDKRSCEDSLLELTLRRLP